MDLNNEQTRNNLNGIMQEVVQLEQQGMDNRLRTHLNPSEEALLDYIRDFKFDGGKWYRPIHDVVCTTTALRIVKADDFPRDLILPTIIHDAGYVNFNLDKSTDEAAWEKLNVREQHMYDGALMGNAAFHMLRSGGLIDSSDERIGELVSMIAVHDNPYLDRPIVNQEARIVRDCDRSYVPSITSWYKDMVSHHGNSKYHKKAEKLGQVVSPELFLRSRMAAFWPDKNAIPFGWNLSRFPLETSFETYNEGAKCEPQLTVTGGDIVNKFMKNRLAEYDEFLALGSEKEFGDFLEEHFKSEMEQLFSYAERS